MKNANPLEKDIERQVCKYARSLNFLVYKFTSPACRSVPDRMLITKNGTVFFIEFKRKGEKPSPAQAIEIAKLSKMGITVYVVDSVEEGKRILDTFTVKDPLAEY